MSTTSSPTHAYPNRALCPACGSASVRILTSVEVQVDVIFSSSEDELVVVDEALGDADWDERSPVACPSCDWRGVVGDLQDHALTALRVAGPSS